MVYRKKTLDEAKPAPEQPVLAEQKKEYPIKKLVIDNNTLLYKIDGEMVDVHIYLDVGLKFQDENKKKRQIPELKMSVERDYRKCAGMTVDQMTHVEVFHFGVDLEELKKSNIADIFARACNGQVPIEGLKTW